MVYGEILMRIEYFVANVCLGFLILIIFLVAFLFWDSHSEEIGKWFRLVAIIGLCWAVGSLSQFTYHVLVSLINGR